MYGIPFVIVCFETPSFTFIYLDRHHRHFRSSLGRALKIFILNAFFILFFYEKHNSRVHVSLSRNRRATLRPTQGAQREKLPLEKIRVIQHTNKHLFAFGQSAFSHFIKSSFNYSHHGLIVGAGGRASEERDERVLALGTRGQRWGLLVALAFQSSPLYQS